MYSRPLCFICQKRPRRLDSSDESGTVEELLCDQCREAMDTLDESIKHLKRAVDLLEGKK